MMIATLSAGLAQAEARRDPAKPTGTPEERLDKYAELMRYYTRPVEVTVAPPPSRVVRLTPERES